MLTQEKEDAIFNALIVGMSLEDSYLYAGCSPQEILFDKEDEESQMKWRRTQKQLEFTLLNNMREVSRRQIAQGKQEATTWLLEKLYPRYAAKTPPELGTISLVMNNKQEDEDAVTTVFK